MCVHADFCVALGNYDVVVTYEQVSTLRRQKVAVMDVAGRTETREALYRHFGDDLVYCGTVGMSHVQSAP